MSADDRNACRWARASTSATRSTSMSSISCITSPNDPATKVVGFYIESIRDPRAFLDKRARGAQEQADRCAQARPHPGRRKRVGLAYRLARVRRRDSRRRIAPIRHRARRGRGRLPQCAARARHAAEADAASASASPPPAGHSASSRPIWWSMAGSSLRPSSRRRMAAMRTILPDWLEPANPFDFWIGIDVKGPREAHEVGLTAVFADPNVDLVLCTLLAPANADFAGIRRPDAAAAPDLRQAGDGRDLWRRRPARAGSPISKAPNVPVFKTTRAAARALSLLVQATL